MPTSRPEQQVSFYTHTKTHTHTHTRARARTHARTRTHASYTHTRTRAGTYTNTHTCTYSCTHEHTHIHKHTCARARTNTHTHKHTHTNTQTHIFSNHTKLVYDLTISTKSYLSWSNMVYPHSSVKMCLHLSTCTTKTKRKESWLSKQNSMLVLYQTHGHNGDIFISNTGIEKKSYEQIILLSITITVVLAENKRNPPKKNNKKTPRKSRHWAHICYFREIYTHFHMHCEKS